MYTLEIEQGSPYFKHKYVLNDFETATRLAMMLKTYAAENTIITLTLTCNVKKERDEENDDND